MGWRSSHGSFRADGGGPVVIEVQPPDELKKVNADDIEARVQEGKRIGRPFVRGNRAAAGRRPKLARLGIDRNQVDHTDPEYKLCLMQAESYRKRRVSEFKKSHGFVSVGAMSLLATASLQLAASRYIMNRAFKDGNVVAIKMASGIANDARQNELAAWELASREGASKAKAAAKELPWVKARVADDVTAELSPFGISTEPLASTEQSADSGTQEGGPQRRAAKTNG